MKVIQTQAEIGEDRVLQVKLPDDTPIGAVDVLVVVDQADPQGETVSRGVSTPTTSDFEALRDAFARFSAPRPRPTRKQRRAAALAGLGMLKDLPPIDEYLEERRADEARREKALGL